MGKLQRKINELLPDIWNARESIQRQQLMKVAEEMEKEFLKFEQLPIPDDLQEALEFMEQRNIEREKWYDKWLK